MPATILAPHVADPLRALETFPHRGLFHPLGFNVEIETNSLEILRAAQESWSAQAPISHSSPTLHVRLGVTPSRTDSCPPATSIRAFGHLLSIIADQENFAVCDLHHGTGFGWVTEASLSPRSYLRYNFLEAIVLCLLSSTHVTPLHGACVSRNGRGLLLCGDSGAGKSTLAYGCARAGWTFTSDDASYLLWHETTPRVRGNAHQFRFRPAARDLFPELQDHHLTPRTEGKPSIEIPTAELPNIRIATEAPIHAVIRLQRHQSDTIQLIPLPPTDLLPYLETSLFPLEGIRQLQAAALTSLARTSFYELRYRELDPAILRLQQLTDEVTK